MAVAGECSTQVRTPGGTVSISSYPHREESQTGKLKASTPYFILVRLMTLVSLLQIWEMWPFHFVFHYICSAWLKGRNMPLIAIDSCLGNQKLQMSFLVCGYNTQQYIALLPFSCTRHTQNNGFRGSFLLSCHLPWWFTGSGLDETYSSVLFLCTISLGPKSFGLG